MIFSFTKSDTIGVLSSGFCLLHCLATPFLFVTQTRISHCCDLKPMWWSSIDFIFLVISAVAIYRTVTNTTKKWMKIALWVNWFLLLFFISNENSKWLFIPEHFIYFPALSLIFLHAYNSAYCQCKKKGCCVN